MIKKEEFNDYKTLVESKDTADTMASQSPEAISALSSKLSVFYARLSGELAVMKDSIDKEFLRLIDEEEMKLGKAESQAEVNVNNIVYVSRRELEYLMKAIDKMSYACATRINSFTKEGHY